LAQTGAGIGQGLPKLATPASSLAKASVAGTPLPAGSFLVAAMPHTVFYSVLSLPVLQSVSPLAQRYSHNSLAAVYSAHRLQLQVYC
jgi:hypothetical protein